MSEKTPLPCHEAVGRSAHPQQPGDPTVRGVAGQGDRLRLRPSHQRILDAFQSRGALTPDELAAEIDRSVFYTRPRCSELRENATSGLRAMVLSL